MFARNATLLAVLCICLIVLQPLQLLAICVLPQNCIEDLEQSVAMERYEYVLSKYEQLNMKIAGKPISVHGRDITYASGKREQHIAFQYVDNTLYDVFQGCVFILTDADGECESIVTVCNTYLGRTPRPLLERQPLTVCADDVRVAETAAEMDAEAAAEATTEVTGSALLPAQKTDADFTADSELI